MSQVFEALRNAEQQAKAKAELGQKPAGEARANVPCAPGVGPAVAPGVAPAAAAAPAKPASAELKQELSLLAVRLEAARQQLEALIADARRVRQDLDGQLERSEKKIQASSLEAMRTGAAAVQADLQKEMELLAEGAAERAERRIAEQAASTVESLSKPLVAELSSALAAGLAQAVEEMSERFRQRLESVARGFEAEAAGRLEKQAEGLVESAAETLSKQMDDSLDLFAERLGRASRELMAETLAPLEKAKAEAEGATRELGAALQACRSESEKIVREVKAAVARELEAQRGAALRQLDGEILQRVEDALARVKAGSSEVDRACDTLHQQVGRGALAVKEWQDQARANLEAGFRQALEALAEQARNLSRAALVEHRREIGLLVDQLHSRIQQAAQAFLDTNREKR